MAALDISPVMALLPDKWQHRAKAVAAAVMSIGTVATLLTATIPNVPTWVPVVIGAVTAVAGPVAVYQTTNTYDPRHDAPEV